MFKKQARRTATSRASGVRHASASTARIHALRSRKLFGGFASLANKLLFLRCSIEWRTCKPAPDVFVITRWICFSRVDQRRHSHSCIIGAKPCIPLDHAREPTAAPETPRLGQAPGARGGTCMPSVPSHLIG